MQRVLRWIGGTVVAGTVALALAFGGNQALASSNAAGLTVVSCSQFCPDDALCNQCCIDIGGSEGRCVTPDGCACKL